VQLEELTKLEGGKMVASSGLESMTKIHASFKSVYSNYEQNFSCFDPYYLTSRLAVTGLTRIYRF
jgi:hypothetical protein